MAIAAHGLLVFDERPGWNQIKVSRVRDVLLAKFRQHRDRCHKLLDIGDAILIEESNMDAFWGIGK